MDIHNNNNIGANKVQSIYNTENAPAKTTVNKNTTNTSSHSELTPVKSTQVSFSVEKDIDVVVTTVVDTNTKQILRQIPSEESIKRLKLLRTHYNAKS